MTSRRRTCIRLLAASAPALLVALASSHDAKAQGAGTTNTPLPNVMLLVDTSGSMERMPDGTLPLDDQVPGAAPGVKITTAPFNRCTPGTESNPNRWGMLVQALTGNMQPFYSCAEMSRKAGTAFANEYKIAGIAPYDTDYALPYHRPLSGQGANACAFAPYDLPGASAGAGVGPSGRGLAGSVATDFPATAFTQVLWSHLNTRYGANQGLLAGNACTFDQALDGQLDATRDYVRFSLMTFDTDMATGTGVTGANPPGGSVSSSPFAGLWTYVTNGGGVPGQGRPQNCATSSPFDVGARHWAAPPWEGRHIPFPDPQGTLYDVARTNDQIQKVIMSTRPYGATPIDGLVEDARDYLWRSTYGPNGSQAGYEDLYVKNDCRKSYIILLTDGAPNLNLRPQCGTGPGTNGGQCPYPYEASETVKQLYDGSGPSGTGPKVTTFVIGFSVNGASTQFAGDGFPNPYNSGALKNCKSWYAGAPPAGGGGTAQGMQAACAAANPPKGSTADACCELNKIAFYGSGASATSVGAFFAETQADLVLSFGRILANISKEATSRTPPSYSPIVTIGGNGVSAKYITSFIPNAQKPWSGEIDRTRATCPTGAEQLQTPLDNTGDSYAQNTAAQASARNRFFISVKGDFVTGSVIDSARTMRPFTSATAYTDGIPAYSGTEVAGLDDNMAATVSNWTQALDIDANTCKRSRVPNRLNPQQTDVIPALTNPNDCRDVIWNFTTASPDAMSKSGPGPTGPVTYDFNVRCRGAGGLATGTCSLSGATCTVGTVGTCPVGEVCVPDCAALGAIYHSTPAVVGAPAAFLREEAFTNFAVNRRTRRPAMFVATTDGVLHAFKALETVGGAQGGNVKTANWEMWGFVPPAVLPRLASNYPTGQQLLLDGSPIVKDVVWDRTAIGDADQWHTTLVAGLGAGGGGYYALNVSDVDCGGDCTAPGAWQQATTLDEASIGGLATRKRGPHFLWQLTDIPKYTGGAETGVVVRTARTTPAEEMVALFGRQSGTPAIATLRFNPGDGLGIRQIGVAILPGGIDGPPEKGLTCARAIGSTFLATDYDRSDTTKGPRPNVRRWAPNCGKVAGRSVTVVRLDTGEIIRHFARLDESPSYLVNGSKVINSPFDSPVIGIPAVFPNAIGQFAQRAIVGDADGTLWNIDLTNTDPGSWKVTLFQDLFYDGSAATSQPIAIPLTLTQDSSGALVVNAATGDQENIVSSAITNYVYSVRETPSLAVNNPSRGSVKWRRALTNGERVTGPMVVFDRILYFASHLPDPLSAVCGLQARSRLWGMDFLAPGANALVDGGFPRWCPRAQVNPTSGICNVTVGATDPPFEDIPEAANAIIPGVTLRPSLACTAFDTSDPAGGVVGVTGGGAPYLDFSYSAPRGTSPTPQAERRSVRVPVPRIAAMVDAWSLVFD